MKTEETKTLYLSDLDGTLLTENIIVSETTKRIINRLIEDGMLFSYATARSFVSAGKITKGLHINVPLIIYNGSVILDNASQEIILDNYFDESIHEVFEVLFKNEIYPFVTSYIDGIEKVSYIEEKFTRGMRIFNKSRKGDRRLNPIQTLEQLTAGNVFYITCFDEPEKLEPLYEIYKKRYHMVYSKDIYSDEQCLEFMPVAASKSNAALQLKHLLKCDRLVVFGDGKNDMDLFEVADECYAMENAVDELKQMATGVIGSNEEDGVARWLEEHYE